MIDMGWLGLGSMYTYHNLSLVVFQLNCFVLKRQGLRVTMSQHISKFMYVQMGYSKESLQILDTYSL